jgi:peptidoglycan/LPS O-acetylase OafA/YrhL
MLLESSAIQVVAREIFVVDYTPFFTAGIFYFKLFAGKEKPDWLLLGLAVIGYVAIWSGLFAPGLLHPGTQPLGLHVVVGLMAILFWRFARGGLRWLSIAPVLFFGHISYSLYLLHQFAGVSIIRFLKSTGANDLVAAGVALASCVVAASVVARFVEAPGQRLLMDFGRRALFPRWSRGGRLGYGTPGAVRPVSDITPASGATAS